MANDELKSLRTEVQTLGNQAATLYSAMEGKLAKGETVGDDQITLDKLITDGQTKRARLDTLVEISNLQAPGQPTTDRQIVPILGPGYARKSVGAAFIESKQFTGRDLGGSTIRTAPFPVGGIRAMYDGRVEEQKDIYSTTASETITTLAPPAYQPEIIDIARQRPPSILDLIPIVPTMAPAIEYVLFSARTNSAGTVGEYSAGNFGLKPKSDMTFTLKQTPVQVIAAYMQASRQILDDAPRLAAEINNELAYEVRVVLEDQIINGDGTGSNFTGILQTSGIQVRTMSLSAPVGRNQTTADTLADTLRRAITDMQLAFYEATGMILNPGDAERLELLKDSQGRYIQIVDPVTNKLWRMPYVVTAAMPVLKAVVGNYRIGCTLWDRMQTTIRIGEPSDLFLRNAVAILAELRAAFVVTRPLAMEAITLI